MAEPYKQLNAVHGQCKCCLKTTYLKNMWEPQGSNGQWEVYGQMLVNCFAIDWTIVTVEDDNMCQVCISKLRVSTDFKKQVLDSQAARLAQANEAPAIEKAESNRVKVETIPTLDGKEVEVSFVPTTQSDLKPPLTNVAANKTPPKQVLIKKEKTTPLTKENCATNLQPKNNNQMISSQKANIIKTPFKKVKVITASASPKTALEKGNKIKVAGEVIETNKVKTKQHLESKNDKIEYENEELVTLEYVDEEILDDMEEDSLENMEEKTLESMKEETLENMDEEEVIYEFVEDTSDNDDEEKPYEDMELSDSRSVEYLDEDEDYEPKPKSRKVQETTSDGRVMRRRSKRKVYTVDALRQAVDAVASGEMSRREAARVFNVPRMKISEDCVANISEDAFITQIVNATRAVLTYTNATPFKVSGQGSFRCFYCGVSGPVFRHPDSLRDHTHSSHPDKVKATLLAVRPRYLNQMVRFDVHDLKCTCSEQITWDTLFEHLKTKHAVSDIDEAKDRIIPYKLTTESDIIPCVFPSCDFSGCFGKVDTHMNIHYPKYLCGECGKPFITEWRLRGHEHYHQKQAFRCKHCPKLFSTSENRQEHIDAVHSKSKFVCQCGICSERFKSEQEKLDHLKEKHADLLESEGKYCSLCGNHFWPLDYAKHVELEHNTEGKSRVRKFKCAICSKQFFSKNAVLAHIELKHNKVK